MKKLKKTLQSVTELAVLPEAYRDELKSMLYCNEEKLRVYGQFCASILLGKLEDCGLNLISVCCYLHQRYEAKQFREMHLFLMMLFVCIGRKPVHQFVEIGHFDDLLEILMDEMMGCFDDFFLDADDLEEDDDDEY